ncbi:uncharacterized protein CTRU02_215818 [Colletotrichum truncatum]|uniref:Uncharacterized protein n=1 Tax=Colletotrichum truncatum TaxID=5467 RepID=A0ACC3YBV8_COLTU
MHEQLLPDMKPCYMALDESDLTHVADGAVAYPFKHLPSMYTDPAYTSLQTDHDLIDRAAEILWTPAPRSKYDREVLHSMTMLAG